VEEKIKREDGDRSSSVEDDEEVDELDEESEDDVENILREAERELVGESDEDSEVDELDDDDEEDEKDGEKREDGQPVAGPSGGFQARIARAKAKGMSTTSSTKKGKWRLNYDEDDDDDDGDDAPFTGGFAWKDDEEKLFDELQKVLDENEDVLKGGNRKSRKKLFDAIRDGNFEGVVDEDDALFASSIVKSKARKRSDLPPELQVQWDKDRAKKADYKRARALERKRQLGNPFKAAKTAKDKGKKGKSNPDEPDTSESDSESEPEFEEINDIFALERMIRVFLEDKGMTTMTLPAMDKESRRRVHLLADCFKLNSASKGKGADRFPILTKKVRSGTGIDQDRIAKILRASKEAGPGSNMAAFNRAYYRKGPSGGGAKNVSGHVEGEVVGAKAAKIGETNVGYKMLQMMGWSEGGRIGLTEGGIVDPLTARIKRTKLGLGAAL